MPTRNVSLLRQVLGHVEAHPDAFTRHYHAEITPFGARRFDFPGHVVNLRYPKALWNYRRTQPMPLFPCPLVADWVMVGRFWNRRLRPVTHVAQELLGVGLAEIDRLANPAAGIEDLRGIVAELCDGVPA